MSMVLKIMDYVKLSVVGSFLFVSCSMEKQEPIPKASPFGSPQELYLRDQQASSIDDKSQEGGEAILTDLYQEVRAAVAQSFRGVAVRQEPLRGLSIGSVSQTEGSSEVIPYHGYEDEMRSNYTSLYKQEYSRIMGSLTYDNDLPTLEHIMSLNLVDAEKARLVTALALTAEIHAAIGNRTAALPIDSIFWDTETTEVSGAQEPTKNEGDRRRNTREIYIVKDRLCVQQYMRDAVGAVSSVNQQMWRLIHDSAVSGGVVGFFGGWVSSGKLSSATVSAASGALTGGLAGYAVATMNRQNMLDNAMGVAYQNYRNCEAEARADAWLYYRTYYTCVIIQFPKEWQVGVSSGTGTSQGVEVPRDSLPPARAVQGTAVTSSGVAPRNP